MRQVLRGVRIVLRPFEERDIPQLLAFAHEPEVARWLPRVDDSYLREHLADA